MEFNPNQSKTWVSFSSAHQICQALFPNFRLNIRNRIKMSKHNSSDYSLIFRALLYDTQHSERSRITTLFLIRLIIIDLVLRA